VSKARLLGAIAGGVGTVVAGAAVGSLAERKVVRGRRERPDAIATEPFGRLPADRVAVVTAADGVPLHVEEVGPLDAPVTVIFSHGYTLEMAMWHFQRQGLADVGRLVFFDHRSHGRSGSSRPEHCSLDWLGRDLEAVVEQRAPRGTVVLVGHSMGGMTIMALADRRPDLFLAGGRVCAVALICTSAGALMESVLGLPALVGRLVHKLTPGVLIGLGKRSTFVEARRSKGLGSDLNHAMVRRLSFGSADVPPSVVDLMERMIASTPIDVISHFVPTFLDHDKLAALPTLRDIPVLIIGGERDMLTPIGDSRRMAEALPSAELVVLQDAGHMAMLERPALVNLHLRALVARARKVAAAA
jgi:pimeloyl-ACP methyl ester carboxylesterase